MGVIRAFLTSYLGAPFPNRDKLTFLPLRPFSNTILFIVILENNWTIQERSTVSSLMIDLLFIRTLKAGKGLYKFIHQDWNRIIADGFEIHTLIGQLLCFQNPEMGIDPSVG